jgi:exodeoxyribonuclease VII large subunit
MTNAERHVYRVSELNRWIRAVLEDEVGTVWLEGELSNVRRPSSGHYYFTLKDEQSQISAVLFRGNQRGTQCVPVDGLQVRVFGEISVYERSGNYQILVRTLEEAGQGALQQKFEALKRKLQAEGLFESARKRPLPVLPQHVGVVTSASGAAIRDILNVVSRRFPNLHVVVAPARVQGDGAADDISSGIEHLNALGGLDVIIVGRGGGSLEDLWCFNEERVARAIYASEIPVISAVGHEIDYTISDFVADLRAPTPSAAAELVVGRKDRFEESLGALWSRLGRAAQARLAQVRFRLDRVARSYVFREPGNEVRQWLQRLDGFELRMAHAVSGRLCECSASLGNLGTRQAHGAVLRLQRMRLRLDGLRTQIRTLDPMAVLARGYSVTWTEKGVVVRDPANLAAGDRLITQVENGRFVSEVLNEGEEQ